MRFKEFNKINETAVSPVPPVIRSKTVDTPPKQNPYVPDLNKKPKQTPKDQNEKPLVDLIAEKKKRKKKKTKLARYYYPGFAYYGGSGEGDMGGGDGGGGESVRPFKAAFNAKPKQKGPGYDKDDYEYTEFVPNMKSKDARQDWAIHRDVKKANAKLSGKSKPATKDTDFYKNYLSNRPIRESNDEVSNEVQKFKNWACEKLHIKNPPKIELSYDTEEAQQGHHTGRHVVGGNSIWVYANNRNLVDILRTVFHELVHVRQGELGKIKPGDSYPGSPIEAQADMLAGKYIKIYGKENNHIFQ